jgi:hypothetical protein
MTITALGCATPAEKPAPHTGDTDTEHVGDSDPGADELGFLVDLVETNRQILFAVQETIGLSLTDLRATTPVGATEVFWSGSFTGTELDAPTGVVSVAGEASFHHQDETFSDNFWTLEITLDDTEVGDRLVRGTLTLDMVERRFEGSFEDHDGVATLTWEDVPHAVSYTASYAWWDLASVDGTVDDTVLSWEADEIAQP